MPPSSRQQQKMIYLLREKYKTKKNTPEEHKWVWEKGFAEPLDETKQETYEYYYNDYRYYIDKVVKDILAGVEEQPWRTLPLGRVMRIWEQYTKFGFIRDEKGMDLIANIVVANIIKLDVNCVLWGATPIVPRNELSDNDYIFLDEKPEKKQPRDKDQLFLFKDIQDDIKSKEDEEENESIVQDMIWEEFDEKMYDYIKYVSDYGREPLIEIAMDILEATSLETKLMLCDKAFIVSHQQYDLTKIFFKNGSYDASKLSGENFDKVQECKVFVPLFESPDLIIDKDKNISLSLDDKNSIAFLLRDDRVFYDFGKSHPEMLTKYFTDNEAEDFVEWDDMKNRGRVWLNISELDNKHVISMWEPLNIDELKNIINILANDPDLDAEVNIDTNPDNWYKEVGMDKDHFPGDGLVDNSTIVPLEQEHEVTQDEQENLKKKYAQHTASPLNKMKKPVHGFGSEKPNKPLEYRQKMYSESFIPMFESPVAINTKDFNLDLLSENVYGFLWLDGKIHIGIKDMEHADIIATAHNDYMPYPDGDDPNDDDLIAWANHQVKYTEIYHSDRVQDAGRFWKDELIVSFWEEPTKEIIIKSISELIQHFNIQSDINQWQIDAGFQDRTKRDTVLVHPNEWNGFVNVNVEARSREQEQHIMSPLKKTKKPMIKGFGSEKETTSLAWKQAKQLSESFIPEFKLTLNNIFSLN